MTDLLERYVDLLYRWNSRVRLVGERDPDIFRSLHLAEVIGLLPGLASLGWTDAVDVGSGNGLLAIPIASRFPDRQVVALEPQTKKCVFLRTCKAELGLPNFEVRQERLEAFRADPAANLLWMARAIEISPETFLQAVSARPGHLLLFTARHSTSWQILAAGAGCLDIQSEFPLPGKSLRTAVIARIRPGCFT